MMSKYHTFVEFFLGRNLSLVISLENLGSYLCQLSFIVFTTLFFQLVREGNCVREKLVKVISNIFMS